MNARRFSPLRSASRTQFPLRGLLLVASMLVVFCGAAWGEVTLLAPNGGESWHVGDTETIRWIASGPNQIVLHYSTDGGATWLDVVPNGVALPASLGSFAWRVPNAPTTSALVRVADAADLAMEDRSDAPFSILLPMLRIMAPNGGERYELARPVTVTWTSTNITTLRLDYSTDNGSTWREIATGIPAAAGSYTFVPTPLPARRALVRLVDAERPFVSDRSDRTFEIMEAKSIIIFSPVSGDVLVRGSQAIISWDAQRIAAVDIFFSSDAGRTWQTVATNIHTPNWSHLWSVPNIKTQEGMIRIREVGGAVVGETGLFTIGDEAAPAVRVILPNGGEKYFIGDSVAIRWSAYLLERVSLYYSTDGGVTWTLIVADLPARQGIYRWIVDGPASRNYRIKVESSPAVRDVSDSDFEVERRKQPSIIVIYPNGGERFSMEEESLLRWRARDIASMMHVEYSIDSGASWVRSASVAYLADQEYTYRWPVPDTPSTRALIRVVSDEAGDRSDSVFEIRDLDLPPIRVITPNGTETWRMGSRQSIEWDAPSMVTSVDIDFSTDGGATWQNITRNAGSSTGSMQYEWWIPNLGSETDAARVRVRNSDAPLQNDISDRPFSIISDRIAGIDAGQETASLQLLGSYPNPATAFTELRWLQRSVAEAEIRLYHIQGAQAGIYNAGRGEPGERRYRLDGLRPGMYLYEVRVGADVVRGKVVVSQ